MNFCKLSKSWGAFIKIISFLHGLFWCCHIAQLFHLYTSSSMFMHRISYTKVHDGRRINSWQDASTYTHVNNSKNTMSAPRHYNHELNLVYSCKTSSRQKSSSQNFHQGNPVWQWTWKVLSFWCPTYTKQAHEIMPLYYNSL